MKACSFSWNSDGGGDKTLGHKNDSLVPVIPDLIGLRLTRNNDVRKCGCNWEAGG